MKSTPLVWGLEGYMEVLIIGYFLLAPDLLLFFLGFFIHTFILAFIHLYIHSSHVYGESDNSRSCFSDYRQK